MKTPDSVILCPNGAVCCFDENGEQIGELQEGWLQLWFAHIESKGINPAKIKTIESIVNGRFVKLRPFKTEDGWWNSEVIYE